VPIYEYRCEKCGKVSSFLVRSVSSPFQPSCKKCQSPEMTRLISRVARVRSEESRLEALADPSKLSGIDENDPAGMARWMKRMGKELGEDVGEDFDSMVDEAMEEEGRGGETPPADTEGEL
jgi:putative FmdB family regulatory protein